MFQLRGSLPLLILGVSPLLAQGTQTAQVLGQIVTRQEPLPQAIVRLRSPSLQGECLVTTDLQGRFSARLLPPGAYELEVSKEGFQTVRIQQRLGLGQSWSPRIALAPVGGATVDIIAARPEADVAELRTAKNLRMEEINTLATERGATDILRLNPGVLEHPNGFLIRGALSTGNLFLVDGQNVQDNMGTVSAGLGCTLIEDSIEEYQILRGALPAEYGYVDGGVVNTITRSGGNAFTAIFRTELKNDAVGALKPLEVQADIPDVWRKASSLALGGYLIQDRLWFFATGYTEVRSDRGAISGDAQPGRGGQGTTFASPYDEHRFQAKLTWRLSPAHSLVLAMNRDNLNQGNQAPGYGAGELRALAPVHYEDSFANLAWRASWSSALSSELRVGRKHLFSRVGGGASGTPVVDDGGASGFVYQNGLYNTADGGDTRDNATLNTKVSLVWSGLGTHETDAGLDYLRETNAARRDGSPTSQVAHAIFPLDFSLDVRRAHPGYLAVFQTDGGSASILNSGLYLNDRWMVNDRLVLQGGLRLEKYSARNEAGARIASATALSPRLGIKYDLFADASWVLGLSHGRYDARIPAAILYQTTHQYHPTELQYQATDVTRLTAFEGLGDRAIYQSSAFNCSSPSLTRINPGLRAPTVNEVQASLAHAFKVPGGEGFVRTTWVQKDWHDLVDWRIGNDGSGLGPDGNAYALTVWDNSPLARRRYRALEAEGGLAWRAFNVGGSATWSSLRGNYGGEDGGPGSGEGLERFSTVNGRSLYDPALLHPDGFLPGHTPLIIRLMGNWITRNVLGKATLGLVYRFNSGSHYDEVRTNDASALSAGLPGQFGSTFTQYRGNARGTGVFNAWSRLDLALGQDIELARAGSRPVSAFLRLLVVNIFNHQQAATFNTSFGAASGSLSAPWVRDRDFGRATSPDNFIEPRGIQIHAGLRF
jgi:hypothetical protein